MTSETRGATPEVVTAGVPRPRYGWVERALSADHKSVGLMYVATFLSFLLIAVVQWVLMRLQLIAADATVLAPEVFSQLMTAQAATVVVLFALPLAVGLALHLVPLQIGARGVALPRLGQLSYWLYLAGGVAMYASFLYTPSEGGTIGLPPLTDESFLPQAGVDAWALGIALSVTGLVLGAVTLLTTLHTMRAPGLAWRRAPIFSWATAAFSYVILIVGPVIVAALVMLLIDRNLGGAFFDPGEAGSPMLYQHLAWIFFSGAWTVIVLFGFGVIAEIVSTFSRRPLLSRHAVAGSLVAIAALGPLAWIQNMYSAPVPTGWMYFAMAVALAMLVPIGLVLFNLVSTLLGGAIRLSAPMIYALAGLSLMFFGLAGELCYSIVAVGWQLSNSVAAHADTVAVIVGASVLGGLGALHYWLPKIAGRTAPEGPAVPAALLIFVGMQLFIWASFAAGLKGQPVDMWRVLGTDGFATANLVASLGAFLAAAGAAIGLATVARGYASGRRVGPDPWLATTLEWFCPSPPPAHNFDVLPDVRSPEPLIDIRTAVAERELAVEPQRASKPAVATVPREATMSASAHGVDGPSEGESDGADGVDPQQPRRDDDDGTPVA